MEKIFNTLGVIFFCLLLVACKTEQKNENLEKLQTLLKGNDAKGYENYLVFSVFQCKGCIEEKLEELRNVTDTSYKKNTLFVLDTVDINFHIVKELKVPFYYIDYTTIDKNFPEIANVYLIRKTDKGIKEKVINAEDSSIYYYLNE